MGITEKQAFVLENLDRVVVRKGDGQSRYSLDGQNCRMQIASLAVQGMVKWDGEGKPSRVVRPEGSDALPGIERGVPVAAVLADPDSTFVFAAGRRVANTQRTRHPSTYRAYRLDHEGCTLGGVTVIEAGDDEHAKRQAQHLVDKAGVELWHGKRRVIWMSPPEGAVSSPPFDLAES